MLVPLKTFPGCTPPHKQPNNAGLRVPVSTYVHPGWPPVVEDSISCPYLLFVSSELIGRLSFPTPVADRQGHVTSSGQHLGAEVKHVTSGLKYLLSSAKPSRTFCSCSSIVAACYEMEVPWDPRRLDY